MAILNKLITIAQHRAPTHKAQNNRQRNHNNKPWQHYSPARQPAFGGSDLGETVLDSTSPAAKVVEVAEETSPLTIDSKLVTLPRVSI